MNKPNKPPVAEIGGIGVVFGFGVGILLYIGFITFILSTPLMAETVTLLTVLCTLLIIFIVGMMDDVLGWKVGITNWKKPLLVLPATVPMIVINSGSSAMQLPIIGPIDLGIFYPLIVIPIAITCASNGFNIVAGYNGLEAGLGVLILSTLGMISIFTGNKITVILSFCMVAALIAFLYFNWYPAKIFPGDSLTYAVGALIACIAIIGNLEKVAIILFIPYFINFFLLPRKFRYKAEAFAKVQADGTLDLAYTKVCDISHMAIVFLKWLKKDVYERDVVIAILMLEVFCIIVSQLYH